MTRLVSAQNPGVPFWDLVRLSIYLSIYLMAKFSVRPAVPEDIPAILKFILDLATYEKTPESAKATPELVSAGVLFSRLDIDWSY